MNKNCKLSTDRIGDLLIYARKFIPWVQANLIKTAKDDPAQVGAWQQRLRQMGYGSASRFLCFRFLAARSMSIPSARSLMNRPGSVAHGFYLDLFAAKGYSDIQEQNPQSLVELECGS